MWQSIKAVAFLKHLFDDERAAERTAPLVEAVWASPSPRLADLARHMTGSVAANYRRLQRFLARVDLQTPLRRLYRADAPFVIADPTDMPRPQAKHTPYVGKLADGQRGFWLLVLATPYRGRALPFGFVIFSSQTIAQSGRSRNQYHWQAFAQLKDLVGDKPLVLDRDFSYADLLEYLTAAGIHFVIRLSLRSHPPTFITPDGRKYPKGTNCPWRSAWASKSLTVSCATVTGSPSISPAAGASVAASRCGSSPTCRRNKPWRSMLTA